MSITRLGDGASVGIDTLAGDSTFLATAYGTAYLHLAASAANGIGVALPSDNDSLTTWSDLSGNSRTFAQESSYNTPKWRSNIKNGQPALEFDGATSARRLILSSTWTPAAFWLCVVAQCDATDTTFLSLATDLLAYNRSSYWKLYGGGTIQSSGASDTAWHVLTFKVLSGASKIYLDGSQVASGSSVTYAGSSANARIGMYDTGTYPFDGYIAEIAVWTSITDGDRLAAERALGAKYGITVA